VLLELGCTEGTALGLSVGLSSEGKVYLHHHAYAKQVKRDAAHEHHHNARGSSDCSNLLQHKVASDQVVSELHHSSISVQQRVGIWYTDSIQHDAQLADTAITAMIEAGLPAITFSTARLSIGCRRCTIPSLLVCAAVPLADRVGS